MTDNYLVHWGKGSTKKNHKYIAKIGNRYFYSQAQIEAFKKGFTSQEKPESDNKKSGSGAKVKDSRVGRSAAGGAAVMATRIGYRAINKTADQAVIDRRLPKERDNLRKAYRSEEDISRNVRRLGSSHVPAKYESAYTKFTGGYDDHGASNVEKDKSNANAKHNQKVANTPTARIRRAARKHSEKVQRKKNDASNIKRFLSNATDGSIHDALVVGRGNAKRTAKRVIRNVGSRRRMKRTK